MRLGSVILLAAALGGCSDRDRAIPPRPEPQPVRRTIEPPATAEMRPLPPYAIRAEGVGPYRIGEPLTAVLEQLPLGPRLARLDIPGVLQSSLVRAEDDTVAVVADPTTLTAVGYVAVLGTEVARTESGIHVGSTRADLVRALGPLLDDPQRGRDPRIVVPAGLRTARFVIADDRVAAIVIGGEPRPPARVPATVGPDRASAHGGCPRPPSTERAFGACLTGNGELVEVDGDELVVRAPDSELRSSEDEDGKVRAKPEVRGGEDQDGKARAKPERTLATLRVPNLSFAVALRNAADNRDELIAVAHSDDSLQRTWTITGYRLEAKGLARAIEPAPLYQLSGTQTRWIGAELRDVDLLLELTSRPDGIEVGGLLVTRAGGRIRDVVPITPVGVSRRHGRTAASEVGDAGVPDAPEVTRDGSGGTAAAKP